MFQSEPMMKLRRARGIVAALMWAADAVIAPHPSLVDIVRNSMEHLRAATVSAHTSPYSRERVKPPVTLLRKRDKFYPSFFHGE